MHNPDLITLDASVLTISDDRYLSSAMGDVSAPDPSMLTAHYIYSQLSNAKCIAMVRDPVQRLYSGYSGYLYNNKSRHKNPVSFHDQALEPIENLKHASEATISVMHTAWMLVEAR